MDENHGINILNETLTATPPNTPTRIAALFDLDKTIIAGSSLLLFCPDLYKLGLIDKKTLLKAKIASKIYMSRLGANRSRTNKFKDDALKITKGWNSDEVLAMVEEVFDNVIDPTVYKEALDLIEYHRLEGHTIAIVSSSPIELVLPIAQRLGVDVAIASQIGRDLDGNLDGKLVFYAHGESKVEAVNALAKELDIELDESYAYSDSITDAPFLECVGNPVAVNPDLGLIKLAKQNGWECQDFREKVTLKERLPVDALSNPWVQAAAGTALVAATGFAVVRRFGRSK